MVSFIAGSIGVSTTSEALKSSKAFILTHCHCQSKMARVPTVVVIVACLMSAIFLLSAMVLLSCIIAWLSLEFSGPIPHALGFILGILALVNSVLSIVMIGVARIRRSLAFIFLITSAISLLAGIALFIPWMLVYATFCEECDETEQTIDCLNAESCPDECCFSQTSRPLALIFVVFSALVLLASIVGVTIAVPYMRYSSSEDSSMKKR